MIDMTPNAESQITQMAADRERAGHGVRLWIVGGGCSGLSYDMDFEDTEKEGDTVVTAPGGLKVYIDPISAVYLDGAHVDYMDNGRSAGFHIDNPNAQPTCSGCSQAAKA